MQYIIDGIYLGLTLAILLGPIFIVLMQSTLEHGTKAGLTAASGIWVSDIIIVSLTLLFIKRIDSVVQHPNFIFWMGLIGGVVLVAVGVVNFMKKSHLDLDTEQVVATGWLGFWTKGFLVNTVNPFTFIFWLSTITSYVATKKLTVIESEYFAIAVLLTIIVTDSLKVLMAKMIRKRINEKTLNIINKVAGCALIIFGFVLLFKAVQSF